MHATPACTADEYWLHVEASWAAIHQQQIHSLFLSSPRHLALIIYKLGGRTSDWFYRLPRLNESWLYFKLIIIGTKCKFRFDIDWHSWCCSLDGQQFIYPNKNNIVSNII